MSEQHINDCHPATAVDIHHGLTPGVPINAITMTVEHIRGTVRLASFALEDAEGGAANHVVINTLSGVETHLQILEGLAYHAFNTSTPNPQPVPDPGAKLTGLLRTMRQEASDAEERGHEIMPSALTHFAQMLEGALAASHMQSEVSHG